MGEGDKILRKTVTYVIFVFLFIYVAFRALKLSFTHDECLSFNIILGDAVRAKTANNHFLNTWLMFICYKIFGAKEFVLRLPNVLAFIIYLVFSYKILNQSKNFTLFFTGICLLLFNPYRLDFFSLARGYGLALAFGLASLYYLLQSNNKNVYKRFVICLALASFFSLLAAYSNLVLINLNISVMLIFFIEWGVLIKDNSAKISLKNKLLPILIFAINIVLLLPLMNQLDTLKLNNELYFGGHEGFVADTLTNLICCFMYFTNYSQLFEFIVKWGVISFFAIVLISEVYKKKYTSLSKMAIVLVLMISASVIQHYVFGALYPIARTALIYIPLFALFIYFFLENLALKSIVKYPIKKTMNVLSVAVICLPLSFHLVKKLNTKYVFEWNYEANTKAAMQEIVKQHQSMPYKKSTISNTWLYEPAINYYRKLYDMSYLQTADRNGVNAATDFIYCGDEEKQRLVIQDFVVLKYFDDTKTVLLKRNKS